MRKLLALVFLLLASGAHAQTDPNEPYADLDDFRREIFAAASLCTAGRTHALRIEAEAATLRTQLAALAAQAGALAALPDTQLDTVAKLRTRLRDLAGGVQTLAQYTEQVAQGVEVLSGDAAALYLIERRHLRITAFWLGVDIAAEPP